jgi:hypothetical protein
VALLALGHRHSTHGFFIRGSLIGGESNSSRASAVINQNERFLYSAGCLTTSSQKTHSDGFLYFGGRPLEVDHRLSEDFDDGAKSRLAA